MTLSLSNVGLSISGKKLVDSLSIKIEKGEVVGLLGPNGAGKTTTFNLIIGLLKADSGDILLNSKSVTHLSMPKRSRIGIGYLSQEPSVFRNLTVNENLQLALAQSQLSKSLQRDRKEKLIYDFNLVSFLERYGYQLSGGERRRCEVARALAVGTRGPSYLLLDEPFAGVDPMAVADLQNLIYSLKERGMGILITDHNVRETLAITNRSYILSNGKILASGPSNEVASNELVRRHYLGEGFKL